MKLKGSCHCQKVQFEFESLARYPYMRCYCSICRKTSGGAGFAINIKGVTESLKITGQEHLTEYEIASDKISRGEHSGEKASRVFCQHCGSTLWASNTAWPQWFFPLASVIDTELPTPPESVHIMLKYCPDWCKPEAKAPHQFEEYPNEGLEDWHQRLGLA